MAGLGFYDRALDFADVGVIQKSGIPEGPALFFPMVSTVSSIKKVNAVDLSEGFYEYQINANSLGIAGNNNYSIYIRRPAGSPFYVGIGYISDGTATWTATHNSWSIFNGFSYRETASYDSADAEEIIFNFEGEGLSNASSEAMHIYSSDGEYERTHGSYWSVTVVPSPISAKFRIGVSKDGGNQLTIISECMVYNRLLSSLERQQLFEGNSLDPVLHFKTDRNGLKEIVQGIPGVLTGSFELIEDESVAFDGGNITTQDRLHYNLTQGFVTPEGVTIPAWDGGNLNGCESYWSPC